jgi:hypothetical protein
MAGMILSILVPTLKCERRAEFFIRLMDRLAPQLGNVAQVIADTDNGEQPIGAKRESLLHRADTPYVAFIDDDDLVPANYVQRVTESIRDDTPDFIGLRQRLFRDGKLYGTAVISRTRPPFQWTHRERGLKREYKIPNHLNPIRTEIARSVGFKPWNMREDGDYARRLAEMHPNLKETFIDAELYDYLLRTDRTGEITNSNRGTQ